MAPFKYDLFCLRFNYVLLAILSQLKSIFVKSCQVSSPPTA